MEYQQTEIGDFPSGWKIDRVDSVFEIQQGKQVSKKNRNGKNQRPFLRTKNILWNRLNLNELDQMNFTESEEIRLGLRPNDLLTCEGGDIGRTARWDGEVKVCYYQNHIHRLRAIDEQIDGQFAVFWFWYAFQIARLYFGRGNITTIPNLSKSRLAELPMAIPPLTEQKKIAHILSTVQRSIEAQERVIRITTELKKALMHKLFTEGLRNEPQKQTEIGPIPESWEVTKIGEIAQLKSGGTPSRKNPTYWDDGNINWIKTGEVDYCKIVRTEEKITRAGLEGSSAKIFPAGTLLIAMYGQGITRGKVAITGMEAATNQACAAIFPLAKVQTKYLYYFLEYNYDTIRSFSHGANQKNLSAELIKSFPVVYPSIADEQKEIAGALGIIDRRIAVAQTKKRQLQDLFCSLLHELISAKKRIHKLN